MKKILSLLAISFSLAFAYTAADVYGAWNTSGKLSTEELFIVSLYNDTKAGISINVPKSDLIFFEKDNLGSSWRWRNGRIEFPNSYRWCELISNKEMDCHDGQGYSKTTYKKAGTIAQYKQLVKQVELDKAKALKQRNEIEKKTVEESKRKHAEWLASPEYAELQKAEAEKVKQREKYVQDSVEAVEAMIKDGFMTDPRDDNKYKVVKIGDQVWMAENLSYDVTDSKHYDNKFENWSKYGRLYNWEMAMKACPSGWHLPTYKEWHKMTEYISRNEKCTNYYCGNYLKAKSGWKERNSGRDCSGEDKYGFSALPGGNGSSNGNFKGIGEEGYWWSSSEYQYGERAFYIVIDAGGSSYYLYDLYGYGYKDRLFSVRCVYGAVSEVIK